MCYVRSGSGPPLVLVHGLLGGSFCWRFVIPFFERHFTVYAIDLPGSGLSDVSPQTDCSIARQAERLLEFIHQSGLTNVNVMGTSFGGAVAMLLAAMDGQQPTSRLRSLVLVAPVNPWSSNGSGRIRFFSSALGGLFLRLTMPFSHPVHRIAVRRMYAQARRIPPGTTEGYMPMIVRPGRAQNVLTTLRNWWRDVEALRDASLRITVPTLLLWGTADLAVDPASCVKLKQQLRNCECSEFEGVGHLPFEETPDEFNERVLEFLEKQQNLWGHRGTE